MAARAPPSGLPLQEGRTSGAHPAPRVGTSSGRELAEVAPHPGLGASPGPFNACAGKAISLEKRRSLRGVPAPRSFLNSKPPWDRSELPYDTGHTELFPLPLFDGDVMPATGTRCSKQRKVRRSAVAADVNAAITALNHTYGASNSDFVSRRSGQIVPPSAAQVNVHQRLLHTVSADRPDSVPPPREAFHGLLGDRAADYFASGTPVLPYSPAKFALTGCENPVDLESLMAPAASEVLSPSLMLQPPHVRDQALRDSNVTLYFDEVLKRDRRAYVDFIGRLRSAGLVGLKGRRIERITPFFIGKRGKDVLRLLLDCRHSNMHFVPPPQSDMGWRTPCFAWSWRTEMNSTLLRPMS